MQTIWMRLLHSSRLDPRPADGGEVAAHRRPAGRPGGSAARSRADLVRTAALFGAEGDELAALPVHREDLPEEVVLRDARQRRLWEHVQGLPDRCRELMRVIAFADRPDYALIAESLQMPVGSIGPTRGRCLAKLRQVLASDPQWEGSES